MMFKFLDFFVLVFYCSFIYFISDQERLPIPALFSFQDKVMHFGAYFVMGVLAWRSFRHQITRPIILALVTLAFCSLYGALDEWHQSFVPGRFSDTLDWVADTSGAGGAVLWLRSFLNWSLGTSKTR